MVQTPVIFVTQGRSDRGGKVSHTRPTLGAMNLPTDLPGDSVVTETPALGGAQDQVVTKRDESGAALSLEIG